MSRTTEKHVRRLASLAELRMVKATRGSGKHPNATVYDFHDARDRAGYFSLFTARSLQAAEAFIAGYTSGRNREIIK